MIDTWPMIVMHVIGSIACTQGHDDSQVRVRDHFSRPLRMHL